jgi:hypothetical protein
VKRIAETLGVARSNLIERAAGKRPKRGPQTRAGDAELTADIRRLVDGRPTYGYRRIAAVLKRERRAAGRDPVNAERVFDGVSGLTGSTPGHQITGTTARPFVHFLNPTRRPRRVSFRLVRCVLRSRVPAPTRFRRSVPTC